MKVDLSDLFQQGIIYFDGDEYFPSDGYIIKVKSDETGLYEDVHSLMLYGNGAIVQFTNADIGQETIQEIKVYKELT